MTREDIIRMARKAGFEIGSVTNAIYAPTSCETELERFAALVAAAERNRTWTQEHWTEYERSIAATEREACAKLADEQLMNTSALFSMPPKSSAAWSIATAIRARGQV
jgi:hypothetical protein